MRPSLVFVLAFALGGVVGVACSGKPACGPANCTGCCDSAGDCQTGFTTLACGLGGNLCRPCFANQVCSLGNCLGGTGGAAGGGSGNGGGGGTMGGGGGSATGGGGGGGATGGGGGGSCGPGTCDGCCTPAGACAGGRNISACGSAGAACVACAGNESCEPVDTSSFGGRCVSGGGGGGGSTGGGGGGVPTGGGAGGGGGSCNSTSCPTGCCQGNACITNQSASQCGTSGNVCTACLTGQTCIGGQCRQCAGCISALGVCESGTSDQACGRNGQACTMCAPLLQTCQAGMCTSSAGGGAGGGTGGGVGGGGTGGGGGLPTDGGLDLCSLLGTPCGSNQCCDGITCVNALAMCTIIPGVCNPVTRQCQ